MCVDLSHLNRYVRRERYQSPTPAEAIADIAATNAKYFTVLDAMKGYHQCPLDADSQLLTPLLLPLGDTNIYMLHTASPPYQKTITAIWQKPWQAYLDSAG